MLWFDAVIALPSKTPKLKLPSRFWAMSLVKSKLKVWLNCVIHGSISLKKSKSKLFSSLCKNSAATEGFIAKRNKKTAGSLICSKEDRAIGVFKIWASKD